MYQKTIPIFILIICFRSLLTINSCAKHKVDKGTDQELYTMALETNGFTWYKNISALLVKSAGSGHTQPLLRVRYNSIAATKLDSIGKVQVGAVFPEGSVIVKELFDNSSTLGRYAVLYKKSDHVDADSRGWVWGYINADGSVAVPAADKGSACSGCHSQVDNIDYMLMNKFFP